MKKIFFITILLFTQQLIANTPNGVDVSEYDRWFNEINDVRVGVDSNNIDALSNPFTTITATVISSNASSAPKLELNAIFDGTSAMINDSWYKLNSRVFNMRLTSIKKNSVVLSDTERTIELYLRKTNENSVIKTY